MKLIFKQGFRHIVTGGVADLVDIGVFNLLFLCLAVASAEAGGFSLFIKAISFLVAAFIKYFGNKIWVFEKNDGHSIKEAGMFAFITAVGLLINVTAFYCATQILPDATIWTEISVIFAMGVTAIWNFLGYKLIVFKK